jgi:hypothetical protein|tara:strand:+ start:32 stop:445 length:414 start_codon:yes stop_codon:yes gene_type:complete
MSCSAISIVHALHEWSEPNTIGVYPFLPHDIVPLIAAQVLQHNREKWFDKRNRERTESIRQECSVMGKHLLSWQLGDEYKSNKIHAIERVLNTRNGFFEMWDEFFKMGHVPTASDPPSTTPTHIRFWNKQWLGINGL